MIESDKQSILFGKSSSHSRIGEQRILRIQGSAVLWTFFILLVVVALGVILLLPDYIDAVNVIQKSEKTSSQTIQPNPGSPDETLNLQVNKESVESSQQQFISLKSRLEVWGVEQWGREDFRLALKLANQGDQLFQQGQMVKAGAVYQSAIAALEQLAASGKQRLQTAISSGEQALEAEDFETARQQFNLALSIEPDNKRATNGMDRTLILEKVAVILSSGSKNEEQDRLTDARTAYKEALAIDPDNVRAGRLLTRIKQKIINKQYRNTMTDGYLALEKKNYAKARQSFKQAKAIKSDSAEVRDALALVDGEYHLLRIRRYKTQAEEFERKEQWQDAINTYQTVLNLDNNLEFALAGKKRSRFYAQLNNDMDYIIQHSDRLASDEPYNSAVSLLKKVQSIGQKSARLKTKLSALDKIVKAARILVPITLESDGNTNIVVYKVGKLGRFSMQKLKLYPGQYTAVGSCPGYQDIRKKFRVEANQPKAYFIRCEEVI